MNWREILDPSLRAAEPCTQKPQNPQKPDFSAVHGGSEGSEGSEYRSAPTLSLRKKPHDSQIPPVAVPEARAPIPEARPVQRAYRVLVRMDSNEPARWVTMVTTDADACSAFGSADRQFGAERVLALDI